MSTRIGTSVSGQNTPLDHSMSAEKQNTVDPRDMDVRALKEKVHKLREEADFWRRSEQVSRHCLKALLQEKLQGEAVLPSGSEAVASCDDSSTAEKALNDDVVRCLQRLEENENYSRKIIALCNEAKNLRGASTKVRADQNVELAHQRMHSGLTRSRSTSSPQTQSLSTAAQPCSILPLRRRVQLWI
eukprot:992414-Rhodomonas_salina.3